MSTPPRPWTALALLALATSGCSSTLELIDSFRPVQGSVRAVAAGAVSACAVTLDGQLFCWGTDRGGVLGATGEACLADGCDPAAPSRVELPGAAATVSVGREHACAVTGDGRAFCWGANHHGQLGSSTAPEQCEGIDGALRACSPAPVEVEGGRAWLDIAAGDTHTCGVSRERELLCWGSSEDGRLGAADRASGHRPRAVAAEGPFRSVTADSAYACATTDAGRLLCWGQTPFGAAEAEGSGSVPVEPFPGERFAGADAGLGAVCAADLDGEVRCTGEEGRWGEGRVRSRSTPRSLEAAVRTSPTHDEVTVGTDHGCAVGVDGVAECWGSNGWGQLGDGTRRDRPERQPVRPEGFLSISAGAHFSCGVTPLHALLCWGSNEWGTLASPVRSAEVSPVAVELPSAR